MRPVASELGSSEGFKRRLIRPTSSRGADKNLQFLKTFDISQNEVTIATIAKADLTALQQDINSIDIDKKIRSEEATMGKNYVVTIKKWLRQMQSSQIQQQDESKVLKALNVDNLTAGFKKVWKICQCLDSLIAKSNELHAISFLKYDELFSSLAEDSIKQITKKLNQIGQGFPASSLQMASVYVERVQDLYSVITKIKKGGQQSTSKQQLNQTKMQSQKLIAELQEENVKLNKFLEQMSKKSEDKKPSGIENISKPLEISKPVEATKVQKSALDTAISQISSSYQKQLQDLALKLRNALDAEAHLKLEARGYKQSLQSVKKESKQNKPVSSASYETTLKQQLDSMKKGYENKISKLKQDYFQRQKQLMRKENEYRIENQKIRFERQLLMKKYDLTK